MSTLACMRDPEPYVGEYFYCRLTTSILSTLTKPPAPILVVSHNEGTSNIAPIHENPYRGTPNMVPLILRTPYIHSVSKSATLLESCVILGKRALVTGHAMGYLLDTNLTP